MKRYMPVGPHSLPQLQWMAKDAFQLKDKDIKAWLGSPSISKSLAGIRFQVCKGSTEKYIWSSKIWIESKQSLDRISIKTFELRWGCWIVTNHGEVYCPWTQLAHKFQHTKYTTKNREVVYLSRSRQVYAHSFSLLVLNCQCKFSQIIALQQALQQACNRVLLICIYITCDI